MVVTLALKATTIFLLPAFIIIILVINYADSWKSAFLRVGLFLSTLAHLCHLQPVKL
jgi:hypothetical protein